MKKFENFCLSMSEIIKISEHSQKLEVSEDSRGDLK